MTASYLLAAPGTSVDQIPLPSPVDRTQRAKKWTAYAAAGVLVGSGAWSSAPALLRLVTGTQTYFFATDSLTVPDAPDEAEAPTAAIAGDIGIVRQNLGLSVSEIAKVTGKSRQAVYKWISGESQPESATAQMITQLAEVGQRMSDAGVRRPGLAAQMGMFGGASLLDVISQGQLTEDHVETVIAEALRGQAAYDASAARRSGTQPTDHPDFDTLPN